MNLEVKDITSKIAPALLWLKKYAAFIFAMVVLLVYGYLVFHINTLASQEPADDAVAERLKTVQRPKIDEDAVDKIEQLQDQNVQVQTLFQQARDNPFTE
jgi:uncharacterized protein involved in cysteine biosynthesis